MKSRRNTSESESEPSGSKLRASRATQDSGLSGVSVEMNAFPRRHGSSQSNYNTNTLTGYVQPRTPDTATAPGGILPIVAPQAAYQPGYQRSAPQSPRHSPRHHHQSSQRASSSSSQDGRNSRRGSRGNGSTRPAPIPTIGLDGEEMFFPLSPAPPKRKSDTGTRLTHGSDSDVLPPDDRNYPVPVFNPAQFQLPPQQEPLPTLQPYRQQQQPSSSHLRIIHASTTGPPSIYWSDDGASNIDSMGGNDKGGAETATIATSTNPSAFTFYREGTPPPGNLSDDDDDDDTVQNEKYARQRRSSQFREIGLAVSTTKRSSKQQKAKASGAAGGVVSGTGAGGGGGGGNGRRPGEVDDDDDDEEDGMNREERDLAEFEFVNGRYVPPGLRDGRMPGRKPVSENRGGDDDDSYYERDRSEDRKFWYISAIIILVIVVVAIGVGVGAGIGITRRNSRDIAASPTSNTTTTAASVAASASVSATAAAIVSGTSTSTSTSTSSSSTSTSITKSLTDCPAANGTTYKVPGSSTTFLRLCGIDYSGTGAAVDLSHLPATSMDDCMNNCAGTSGCTACGWGPANSSTTSSGANSSGFTESGKNYQCYMKSTLGSVKTAVEADDDWCFAILQ